MQLKNISIFFMLCSILSSVNAFAEAAKNADEKQPITIQADRLSASEKQGKSIYQGNVVVTQGSLTLKGDSIEVFHPGGSFKKTITKGSPATFKRFDQTEQSWVQGSANSIEYDTTNKTVVLSGNAKVEQPGKHMIQGSKLFYDITAQTLEAKSSPEDKKRVSVTFTPATEEDKATNKQTNPESTDSNAVKSTSKTPQE